MRDHFGGAPPLSERPAAIPRRPVQCAPRSERQTDSDRAAAPCSIKYIPFLHFHIYSVHVMDSPDSSHYPLILCCLPPTCLPPITGPLSPSPSLHHSFRAILPAADSCTPGYRPLQPTQLTQHTSRAQRTEEESERMGLDWNSRGVALPALPPAPASQPDHKVGCCHVQVQRILLLPAAAAAEAAEGADAAAMIRPWCLLERRVEPGATGQAQQQQQQTRQQPAHSERHRRGTARRAAKQPHCPPDAVGEAGPHAIPLQAVARRQLGHLDCGIRLCVVAAGQKERCACEYGAGVQVTTSWEGEG